MHAPQVMDLVGAQVGNYIVRARIGGGGMGTVYLCEHPLLGRRAALKVLHEELASDDTVVERFFHEAKAVNDIGHENIVDVIDFGRTRTERGEIVYLMMELLDGESLSARIKHGPLPLPSALHIMAQCCSALTASHDKGIVHRDLKPENIFLCHRGADADFVKIVDFGIAKLMSDPSASKTRTGMVLGTPQYMSPEQCEGKGRVDHRADIYSLGAVLFEILTGRVPFDDAGVGDVMVAHMTRPPPRPSSLRPELSPALDAVVLHALEKDPGRRFQTMAELASALADPGQHLANYQELPRAQTLAAPVEQVLRAQSPTMMSTHTPNTLSGASGEVVSARHRTVAPILATVFGVVALAGLAGTIGLALTLRSRDQRTTPPPPASTQIAERHEVQLSITTDPPSAMVVRLDSGQIIGMTPIKLPLVEGSPPFEIELRLQGYETVRRPVLTNMSRELIVHLTRLPVAATPARPAAQAKPIAAKPIAPKTTAPKRKLRNDDRTILPPAF